MQAAARKAVERAESGLARQPENPRPAYLGAAALITLGDKDRARVWQASPGFPRTGLAHATY